MEAIGTGQGIPAPIWALWRRRAEVRRLAGRFGLLLPGVAVVGLSLDQPGWAPLAWLAFAPLLLLQRIESPAASASWTAVFALGAYGLLLHPMLPVTPAGYVLILAGTAAIYGLTGGLVTALWGDGRWSPLGVASLWTLAEAVKTGLGLAWGTLGYSQWSLDAVRLSARGVGVLGLSLLVWWANAYAVLWLGRLDLPRRRRAAAGAGLAAGLAATALLALTPLPAPSQPPTRLEVALVPGHFDNRERMLSESDPGLRRRMIDAYLTSTRQTLAGGRAPMLAVWPETALRIRAGRDYWLQAALAARPLPAGASLLLGALGDDGSPDRVYNSAFALDPRGKVLGRYDKQRLVPHFESQPVPWLWSLLHQGRTFDGYAAGPAARPLDLPFGRVAVSVCYDENFAEGPRRQVADGAQLLVTLGSHTLFDEPQLAGHLQRFARFRAVETGRWLVRVVNGGESEVIDPRGRVVWRLGRTAPAGRAAVPLLDHRTPYVRAGGRALLALPLACAAWGLLRRLPRRRPSRAPAG